MPTWRRRRRGGSPRSRRDATRWWAKGWRPRCAGGGGTCWQCWRPTAPWPNAPSRRSAGRESVGREKEVGMPARTQRDTGNGAVVRRRILAAVLLTAVVIGLTVLLPRTQSPQGESGTSPRGYPAPVLLQLQQQCLVMPGTKESFCDCAVARL